MDLGTESNGVGRVLEGRPDTNLLRVLVHSSPDASWTYRNGSGTNQWILANQSQPRIGASWNTSLNCIGHSPSAAFLFMFESPSLGPQIPAGELLVDTLSQRYLLLMTPHSSSVASFHVPIPNDPALCALRASVQGVCLGSPGLTLSNAIDIQIGL